MTVEEGKEAGEGTSSGLVSDPVAFVAASEVKAAPKKLDTGGDAKKSAMHPMFKNNKPKKPTRKSPAVKVENGVVEFLDSDEEDLDGGPVVAAHSAEDSEL